MAVNVNAWLSVGVILGSHTTEDWEYAPLHHGLVSYTDLQGPVRVTRTVDLQTGRIWATNRVELR